jgi:hypothetical protein
MDSRRGFPRSPVPVSSRFPALAGAGGFDVAGGLDVAGALPAVEIVTQCSFDGCVDSDAAQLALLRNQSEKRITALDWHRLGGDHDQSHLLVTETDQSIHLLLAINRKILNALCALIYVIAPRRLAMDCQMFDNQKDGNQRMRPRRTGQKLSDFPSFDETRRLARIDWRSARRKSLGPVFPFPPRPWASTFHFRKLNGCLASIGKPSTPTSVV